MKTHIIITSYLNIYLTKHKYSSKKKKIGWKNEGAQLPNMLRESSDSLSTSDNLLHINRSFHHN